MRRSILALLLTVVATAGVAHAADVRVTYVIDAKALRSGAPAGTALTFELHASAACAAPVATSVVNVEDVTLLATVKAAGVTAGPKRKQMTEIRHVLTGVAPQAAFYLRVTGDGVVPIGGACQLQHASVGADVATVPASCPPDAVIAGTSCADKYEASLWSIPPAQTAVIQKVKDGIATFADLNGAGATQVGCTDPPYNHASIPANFPVGGQYTAPVYAASIAGVRPSACVSAPQAMAACALADKHLMTNAEWETAAAGTPSHVEDIGGDECNTFYLYEPLPVGSRASCVSTAGAYDMVGNAMEWTRDPGIWVRGGAWGEGQAAGVMFGLNYFYPTDQHNWLGFRCAR